MRSKSVAQLSSIRLIFEKGTDETRARQLVQERVAQVAPSIPTWASPPWMMPALSATSRIMKIGLTSEHLDLIELSSISYWKIRQHLLRVPGVAGVDIYGERLKQRHVQVDPALLAKYDIPIDTVMEAGSEALDAGVLQYAEELHRRTRRLRRDRPEAAQHRERPTDHRPGRTRQGPCRRARRQGAADV